MSTLSSTRIRVVRIAALFLVSAGLVKPVAAQDEVCRRYDLARELAEHGKFLDAVSSVAWMNDNTEVVVTDAIGHRVLVFSDEMRYRREVPLESRPILGVSAGDQFVQVARSSNPDSAFRYEVQWHDRAYRLAGRNDLAADDGGMVSKSGLVHMHVYNMVAMEGGAGGNGVEFLAYGAAIEKRPDRTNPPYATGFFRVRLRSPQSALPSNSVQLVFQDERDDFYGLGLPYMAAIGDTAYFVDMRSFPTLWYQERGGAAAPMWGFPGQDNSLPDFQVDRYRGRAKIYKAIEGYDMPAGLFAEGEALYELHRKPGRAAGTTTWTLTKLLPDRGAGTVAIAGTMELATKFNHLAVLPGPQKWLVFEMTSVNPEGKHEVPSVLSIPSSSVSQSESCASPP